MEVKFYSLSDETCSSRGDMNYGKPFSCQTVEEQVLKFAVIISRADGKWVFCKHKDRNTYEVPGGHREENESILETAKRELYEETGAIEYDLRPVCVYSVIGRTRVNQTGEETFATIRFSFCSLFYPHPCSNLPFQTGQERIWKCLCPAYQTQSIPAVQFFLQCFIFTSRKEKINGCPCPVSSAIHAPKV